MEERYSQLLLFNYVMDERTDKQFPVERWISHMEIHIQKRIHVSVTSEQSKPILCTRPCGDIFTENHVAEPFSTNTVEGVASSVALFPASTREQRSTYAFLNKTFSVAKAS